MLCKNKKTKCLLNILDKNDKIDIYYKDKDSNNLFTIACF
jgi:hypothetical protein